MDVEFEVSDISKVPVALRECYTQRDGKFVLNTKGEHPKVTEFRNRNVEVLKERDELKARIDGMDVEAAKVAQTKLAELEAKYAGIDPDAARTALTKVPTLEQALATERASKTELQRTFDATTLRDGLKAQAAAAGARASALDIIAGKLEPKFTVANGVIAAKPGLFSPDHPGTPLTVEEELMAVAKGFDYLFEPSKGGGAPGGAGGGGGTSSGRVLRNPTPQQLGQHAKDIRAGKIRVEYEEGR
jgi:hypothetical protein